MAKSIRLIASVAALLLLCPAGVRAQAGGTIDVTTFGAKPDGVTDDTAALRSAAAAVRSTGAVLLFPKGAYVIKGTIYLKSHTHVEGKDATLLAAVPWHHDFDWGGALLENVNHAADKVTDTDISVNGMTFDYGDVAPVHLPKGGKHAVRFTFTSDIAVTNNVFKLRGSEDAVAGIAVVNMRVQGNSAYEFRNCAYDFWGASTNVRIYENFAETEKSAQMVNFNPEFGWPGDSTKGLVARGLVMTGNKFVTTGPSATAILIAPLGPGTAVRDVLVANNMLVNTCLVVRGDIKGAVISGNTLTDIAGGGSAYTSYPFNGGMPDSIICSNNRIVNPQTKPFEVGVLRMQAQNSYVIGNSITGSNYTAAALDHGAFNVTQVGNTVEK